MKIRKRDTRCEILRRISCLLLISLVFVSTYSELYGKGAGSTSVTTLLIPTSARISALAEASTSLQGDISLLNYNPSGIAKLMGKQVSFAYQRGFAEDNYANVHVGRDYKNLSVASSLLFYSTGKIDLYKSNGTLVSKVGKRDIILSLGASKKIWAMPVGVNIKFISSELFGEQAVAVAGDIGLQYKYREDANIGLAVKNVGSKIKYISESESLPMIIQAGGSFKTAYKGYDILLLDDIAYYVNEQEILYMLGGEVSYDDKYFLRSGYKINISNTKNQSINFGAGLNYKSYTIDYSVELNQGLTIPHRISLASRW